MSDLFLLSKAQMARISPHFPLSHGVPRVDDRRVVGGIVYVIRNGLQWKDAPKAYGPHKTLYNCFIRWSLLGVFDRIFASLAGDGPKPERIMIDATLNPLRPLRSHILLGHLHRRQLHILSQSMSPDPSCGKNIRLWRSS